MSTCIGGIGRFIKRQGGFISTNLCVSVSKTPHFCPLYAWRRTCCIFVSSCHPPCQNLFYPSPMSPQTEVPLLISRTRQLLNTCDPSPQILLKYSNIVEHMWTFASNIHVNLRMWTCEPSPQILDKIYLKRNLITAMISQVNPSCKSDCTYKTAFAGFRFFLRIKVLKTISNTPVFLFFREICQHWIESQEIMSDRKFLKLWTEKRLALWTTHRNHTQC